MSHPHRFARRVRLVPVRRRPESRNIVHFGLEQFVPITLYSTFWLAILLSIFWRPIAGIYYIVPLIPAQTFRDRLAEYPLGSSVIILVLIAVAIGLMRRGKPVFPRSFLKTPLFVYAGFTFLSLCYGSLYLGHIPFASDDPRVGDWRNYITMLFLVFLVSAAVTTTKEMKILLMIMSFSVLLFDRNFWDTVSNRDYSSYSEDLRTDAGAVGYAGLNGLAALEAQVSMAFMALAAFERSRFRWLVYVGVAFFSSLCLMYSLSRGAYIAFIVAWGFLGLVKYRKLLVLLIVFGMTWTTVVPNAVVQRVFMTTDSQDGGALDHSSETRVTLWEDAMDVFHSSPVIGTGWDTYAYMGRVGNYRDTHNIYIKFLVETGVVGLLLFLWLVWRTFWGGFRLSRVTKDPVLASLGLALAVWMVASVAANFFGDRWTYLQVQGYMWVIAGLVARGWQIEQERAAAGTAAETQIVEPTAAPETAVATLVQV
jgi:putative inorganic carbon (HCO3(-)) transporter